jgi:hypothetical protein
LTDLEVDIYYKKIVCKAASHERTLDSAGRGGAGRGGLNSLMFLCIIINCAVSSARVVSTNGTLLYIKQATSSGTYRLVSYGRTRHLLCQHIALANCEAECVMYDCITKATTPLYSYTDLERLYRAALAASGRKMWSKQKKASEKKTQIAWRENAEKR